MKIKFCSELPLLPRGCIAVIDGKLATTSNGFFDQIWKQLDFPDYSRNWDAYLDWMRDLSWIKEKNVSVVITNYEYFLSEALEYRDLFISDIKEAVATFWEEGAINVFENEDAVKNIFLFCINSDAFKDVQVPTSEVASKIKRDVLGGRKTPHKVSQPVLRVHNGKLFFSAFVFFYNKEDIQTQKISRPSLWVLADIWTGEIVHKFSCPENDFSDADYNKKYSLASDGVINLTQEDWREMYKLLDAIRIELFLVERFNKSLYEEYFDAVISSTPEEYQRFYKELNNLSE